MGDDGVEGAEPVVRGLDRLGEVDDGRLRSLRLAVAGLIGGARLPSVNRSAMETSIRWMRSGPASGRLQTV